MTTPTAFDPRTAGWSWGDLGMTEAEAQKIPVSAEVEAYSAKKDPVRSGKILTLAAPSPVLRLPDAFTRFDVTFGVVDGYGTRGYLPMTGRGGLINHWIVSTYTGVARRQTLGLIINGHSTLAGPLANLYMDFDGHVLIVAALSANHGGVGTWRGVSENPNWIGIECEGGPTLTAAQLAALPKVNAAVAYALGKDPSQWCIGHNEYAPRRKVDIGGYITGIRTQAAQLVAGGTIAGGSELNSEERTWLQNQLNALAQQHSQYGKQELDNANANARRLESVLTKLDGTLKQLHDNDNANARRIIAIAEKLGVKL